jgi:hypothetical protein
MMEIFIKTNEEGHTLIVHVNESDTVMHVKELIQRAWGVPPDKQSLTYVGKGMADSYCLHHHDRSTLLDYKLRSGYTVQLRCVGCALKLPTQMCQEQSVRQDSVRQCAASKMNTTSAAPTPSASAPPGVPAAPPAANTSAVAQHTRSRTPSQAPPTCPVAIPSLASLLCPHCQHSSPDMLEYINHCATSNSPACVNGGRGSCTHNLFMVFTMLGRDPSMSESLEQRFERQCQQRDIRGKHLLGQLRSAIRYRRERLSSSDLVTGQCGRCQRLLGDFNLPRGAAICHTCSADSKPPKALSSARHAAVGPL